MRRRRRYKQLGDTCSIEAIIGQRNPRVDDHLFEQGSTLRTGTVAVCLTPNQAAELFDNKQPDTALGCGTFACAYEDPRDPAKVVKITYDQADVDALMLARGVPGVVKTYGAWKLKQKGRNINRQQDTDVFAVKTQRVYPLDTTSDKWAYTQAVNLAWLLSEETAWTGPQGKFKVSDAYLEAVDQDCDGNIMADKGRALCKRWARDTKKIFERLAHRGIVWGDIHHGNVGLLKGKLHALDLGITALPKDLPALPELAGQRRRKRRR